MNTRQKVNLGPLWIFIGYFCSSTTGLTQAFAPESATSLSIGGMRLLSGGLFLLFLGIVTGKLPQLKTLPKKSILLATLSLIAFQLGFFAACRMVGVAVGSVIAVGVVPIVVGVFAWLLLKERPTRIWYIATFFMLIGLTALGLSGGDEHYSLSVTGIFLAVAAGFGYGLFIVFIKPALENNGSSEIMIVVFLLGGLMMLPIILSQPLAWMVTGRGMLCIFNLGAITAALAFTLILYGMRTTSASLGGAFAVTEPFCAALWGIFILGEQVGIQGYVGLILILISSITLIIPQKQAS